MYYIGPTKSAHYCEQISPKEYQKEADEYTKKELEKLFEYLAKHPEAKKRSKVSSYIEKERYLKTIIILFIPAIFI